jgi:hypothetical protein
VALTKAALAEEIAAERSIFAEELALDNLRPAERQKILAQLAAAEEKYAQQVKETQLKAGVWREAVDDAVVEAFLDDWKKIGLRAQRAKPTTARPRLERLLSDYPPMARAATRSACGPIRCARS